VIATEMLDAGELDRLAALEQRAMRGPWSMDDENPHREDGWLVFGGDGDGLLTCHGNLAYGATDDIGNPDQDARFIVALRNAAPALIALARAGLAAQTEIARLSGILATLEGAIEDALEAAGRAQQRKGDGDAA